MGLLAVADATEILAPGCLLCVAGQIRPGDVMVMTSFATPSCISTDDAQITEVVTKYARQPL